MMKKPVVRRILRIGIPILLALLVVAYAFISYQMASGVTRAQRKALTSSPEAVGLRFEDVEFSARGGGLSLRGWYIPAQTPMYRGAVIFVHGHSSNREEDGDFLDLSAELVKRGYTALLFDLRGHGRSDGEQVSGGFYERRDVLGAFDFMVKRGLAPERIAVLGFSMGAATTLMSVAEEPSIRAAVADSAFADVSDLITQEAARTTVLPQWLVPIFIPGMKVFTRTLYGIRMGEIVPENAVKRLSYPILVVHGTGDKRIPFEQSVRIHKAANTGSEIWLVPDVGHTDAYKAHPAEYVDRLLAYLDARLGAQ